MKYELLITDLDDTLLKDDGTISKKNKDALRKLINSGGKVALASGRAEPTMENVIKMVGLSDQKHLAHNGLSVFNLDGYRKVYNFIPKDEVKRILDLLKVNNIESNVLSLDGIFHNHSYKLVDVMDKYEHGYPVIDVDYTPYDVENIFLMYGLINNEEQRKMMRSWGNDVIETGEGNGFVIFFVRGEGKFQGAKRLAKEFGIDEEKIVCVGDGGNDLQMLRDAPLGIAVKNAVDEAKEAAKVIIDKTNEEDAISYVIEKYFLGE